MFIECLLGAIAEKLHAMVVLGEANSRMRDFFDISALAQRGQFDGESLTRAVRATFERRKTQIPLSLPIALSADFGALPTKQAQWQAFLRKNGLDLAPPQLGDVVTQIASFLEPVIAAARDGAVMHRAWRAGGPWQDAS